MKKPKSSPQYCSKTGLKHRGWTDKAIAQILGKPDKETPNPHYRSGPKIKLYLLSRVETDENSKPYQQFLAANAPKRLQAKQAIETKRKKLLAYVQTCSITVEKLRDKDVTLEAIDAWNWRQFERSQRHGYDYTPATAESETAFLERITVNFIRHNLCSYDERLADIFGKVATEEGYKILSQRIFAEIAWVYPSLRGECERQFEQKFPRIIEGTTSEMDIGSKFVQLTLC